MIIHSIDMNNNRGGVTLVDTLELDICAKIQFIIFELSQILIFIPL